MTAVHSVLSVTRCIGVRAASQSLKSPTSDTVVARGATTTKANSRPLAGAEREERPGRPSRTATNTAAAARAAPGEPGGGRERPRARGGEGGGGGAPPPGGGGPPLPPGAAGAA